MITYGRKEIHLIDSRQQLGVLYNPIGTEKGAILPSPLSFDTPVDKRNLPVENRFEEALKKARPGTMIEDEMGDPRSGIEIIYKQFSTKSVAMAKENEERYSPVTTRKLLDDLTGNEWADTAKLSLVGRSDVRGPP